MATPLPSVDGVTNIAPEPVHWFGVVESVETDGFVVKWPPGLPFGKARAAAIPFPTPALVSGEVVALACQFFRPPAAISLVRDREGSAVPEPPLSRRRFENNAHHVEDEDGDDDFSQHQRTQGTGRNNTRQSNDESTLLENLASVLVERKLPDQTLLLTKGLRVPSSIAPPFTALYPHLYVADQSLDRWHNDLSSLLQLYAQGFRDPDIRQEFVLFRDTMMSQTLLIPPAAAKEEFRLPFAWAARVCSCILRSSSGDTVARQMLKRFEKMWEDGTVNFRDLLERPNGTTASASATPAAADHTPSGDLAALKGQVAELSKRVNASQQQPPVTIEIPQRTWAGHRGGRGGFGRGVAGLQWRQRGRGGRRHW
jgi:hypothetical protein